MAILMALLAIEWGNQNRLVRFLAPACLLLFSADLSSLDIDQFYYWKEWCRIAGLLLLTGLAWVSHLREFREEQTAQWEETQRLRVKTEAALESHRMAMEHVRQIGFLHHEFRHHTAALMTLIDCGDYPGLAIYLKKIDEMQRGAGRMCVARTP